MIKGLNGAPWELTEILFVFLEIADLSSNLAILLGKVFEIQNHSGSTRNLFYVEWRRIQ